MLLQKFSRRVIKAIRQRRAQSPKSQQETRLRPMLETLERRELMAVVISEVYPAGSSNGTYNADWFEVTNTGPSAVDITGWKVDDNSNSSALAAPLRGLTSIPAGKSAVFFEGLADGSTDATITAAFSTAWFGSPTLPSGFLIGAYGGPGVDLDNAGDAVNLFDSVNGTQASVSFGVGTAGQTFDNTIGLNNTTISTLSVAGLNGSLLSSNGAETGSPGRTFTGVDLSR